jgi:hypothetical protein
MHVYFLYQSRRGAGGWIFIIESQNRALFLCWPALLVPQRLAKCLLSQFIPLALLAALSARFYLSTTTAVAVVRSVLWEWRRCNRRINALFAALAATVLDGRTSRARLACENACYWCLRAPSYYWCPLVQSVDKIPASSEHIYTCMLCIYEYSECCTEWKIY